MKKTLLFIILCLPIMAMGATKTLVGITAGGLKAALTSPELASTTELIVSGVIDARDFKTMRDDMPLLADIDLSGATVAEYSGVDGSAGANITFYAQNALPSMSFFFIDSNSGKTSLTSFIYPQQINAIGEAAFYKCSGITGSLLIPATVKRIESSAFYGCTGFSGPLSLPSAVESISKNAFYNCSGFSGSLTIPATVQNIGEVAFYNCSGLTGSLNLLAPLTSIENGCFAGCRFTGSLVIPESVVVIGPSAFEDCKGFTGNLIIPPFVSSIGSNAFYGCEGFFGTVVIPETVLTIGRDAFLGCGDLLDVAAQNPNYSSLGGVLFNKAKTSLIRYPENKIGSYTIPNSVQIIESYAFSYLTTLTGSLIIPESVTSIGDFAFSSNIGLTSITIPSSINTIGVGAFLACNDLESIISLAPTPLALGSFANTFNAIDKTSCTLYVPVGSKHLYEEANQWKTFTNIVEGFPTSLNKVLNNTITIYPNPATSSITISELGSLEGNQNVTVSIVDVLGNVLLVKEVEPTINSLSIDVSVFKKGIYFINLQTSNGSVVKRFVKE